MLASAKAPVVSCRSLLAYTLRSSKRAGIGTAAAHQRPQKLEVVRIGAVRGVDHEPLRRYPGQGASM